MKTKLRKYGADGWSVFDDSGREIGQVFRRHRMTGPLAFEEGWIGYRRGEDTAFFMRRRDAVGAVVAAEEAWRERVRKDAETIVALLGKDAA